ncbi:hypothetical protein [Acinetobacter seifertii]|uniref:Uncharacterized protein n=1 Tax=Acinetobacter seifertii TaxID=1530123 RepID=A0A7H2V906_9GAMM|nr:hypothetical protein [Acinetobacter seifertii]QNX72839.1 hypothetical protein IC776_02760 [Acinetobacter seifertii]
MMNSLYATFDPNALPFISSEQIAHDFEEGDVVYVPSRFAQHKLVVNLKQRFIVEDLIGKDQLRVKCLVKENENWEKFNQEFTAHYSHFVNLG